MQFTAVITGSSNGIGRASALEFLQRECRVFGVDLSLPRKCRKGSNSYRRMSVAKWMCGKF